MELFYSKLILSGKKAKIPPYIELYGRISMIEFNYEFNAVIV